MCTENAAAYDTVSFLVLQQLAGWGLGTKLHPPPHTHICTWAVDVHMNGLPGVLGLQKEQLCHYQTGVLISDLHRSNVHHINLSH